MFPLIDKLRRAPALEKLQARLSSESDCIQFLYDTKWPGGFCCTRCGHSEAYRLDSRRLPLFQCVHCRHQSSLLTGTIMEGSRTPLLKWYTAMFLLARASVGITATRLSKQIQVTYKTAWLMLHKIRHAISKADEAIPLTGKVCVSREVFGRNVFQVEPQPGEVHLFTAASFDQPYLKIKLASHPHARSLHNELTNADLTFKASCITSNFSDISFYSSRHMLYRHVILSSCSTNARFWIRRTFKGITPKYLQRYLDEFCFCFNQDERGTSAFEELSKISASTFPITLSSLRSSVQVAV